MPCQGALPRWKSAGALMNDSKTDIYLYIDADSNDQPACKRFLVPFRNFFKSPGNAPEIQVSLGGTLNVLCPYSDGPKYQHKLPIFDIFMVDRRSYEKCRLPDSDGTNRRFKKLIYSCDQPFERKKLTLQVLQVSPIFDAPVFNPDQAYYFVTSEQKLCERGLKLTAHVTQGK